MSDKTNIGVPATDPIEVYVGRGGRHLVIRQIDMSGPDPADPLNGTAVIFPVEFTWKLVSAILKAKAQAEAE